MNENKTALVTGASSGIGLALARRFAAGGFNLVLSAPEKSALQEAADSISKDHPVSITTIARDLTRENAADDLYREVHDLGIRIDLLVNNAGIGQRGKFHESPLEKDIAIIRLNVEALVRLTKKFLPEMVQRGSGRVLNVGSIAGFQPGPLLAIYHATKAFVVSFSEAIATELADTGVTVTCLCPGPVDTNFDVEADMENSRAFQSSLVMEPDQVADAAYEATLSGQRIIIPGIANKALTFGRRFLPEEAQAKANQKLYEDKK